MPDGFFHSSTLLPPKETLSIIPQCDSCKLWRGCNSPKMGIHGEGRKKILIYGEAPGESEDSKGIPFIGKAGQYLRSCLNELGIDLDRDCWTGNSLRCCPPANRTPTPQEIGFCRPNLTKAIRDLEPDVIIPLGGPAVQSLIGGIWKEDVGQITRWVGWEIPCQKPNAWIFPNFHPSYVIRSEGKPDEKVIKLWFSRWLKTAVEREGKPWPNGVPDFTSACQVIINPDEASKKIRKITSWALEKNKPLAFDYECDRLKSQRKESLLYSCSISNGKVSISYPMTGEAREATKEFLVSKVKKIAANSKYEILWSYFALGVKVSSIIFDTMISAHILDNRQKTKSLKFQAFVLLGQTSYDDPIKMFFKSNGTNEPNRIKEIELNQLLLYGAMDSLLEYKIAMIQSKQLGIEL